MTSEVDIRSLTIAEAAELLGLPGETIRVHIRRSLPLVGKRIDVILCGAWLNQASSRGDYALASQHGEQELSRRIRSPDLVALDAWQASAA